MDHSALFGWITRHQQTLTWLAGGVATAAGGVWVAIRYFVERPPSRPAESRASGTNVSASGSGIAAARDVKIEGGVHITSPPVPKAGIALALVGLSILGFAVLRGGSTITVQNGVAVGGTMTNNTVTITPGGTPRP